MTEHTSIHMRAGLLALRDATPSDADAYTRYWTESSPDFLEFLGVDRLRIGSPDTIRERFLSMIRDPSQEQRHVILSITLNGKLIGYSNINCYGPSDNYAHLHTYRWAVRDTHILKRPDSGYRGGSVGLVVIGLLLPIFFTLFPVERLTLQTRTRNRAINHALDHYLPSHETRFFQKPDGLSNPGEFHMRYIQRGDLPGIQQRMTELAAPPPTSRAGDPAKQYC